MEEEQQVRDMGNSHTWLVCSSRGTSLFCVHRRAGSQNPFMEARALYSERFVETKRNWKKKKKKELHESNDFLCRMHKSIRGRTGRSELFFAMITFVPLFAYSCFSHLDCTSRLMVSVLLKAASQAVLSETKGHKVTDF